jgi:hypothetical protein
MDKVNNPKHYTTHPSGIDCIQVVEHYDFCSGNAIKYVWRYNEKNNPVEDLKKGIWYVKRRIDMYKKEIWPEFPKSTKQPEIQKLCKKYYESESDELIKEAVKLLMLHKYSRSSVEDLKKAIEYIERKIKLLEGGV